MAFDASQLKRTGYCLPLSLGSPSPVGPGTLGSLDFDQRVFTGHQVKGSSWQTPLPERCRFGGAHNGALYLHSESTLYRSDDMGRSFDPYLLPLRSDESIGAMVVAADSIVLALFRSWEYLDRGPNPRVMMLSLRGAERWVTALPVGGLSYSGCVWAGEDSSWRTEQMPPWNPTEWSPCGKPPLLSGEAVVVSYVDDDSGIGRRYALDAGDGNLVWQSSPGPVDEAGVLSDGSFWLSMEGYDAFDTELYVHGKGAVQRWRSRGRCFRSSTGELLCVEKLRETSRSLSLTKLCDDGSVSPLSDRLPPGDATDLVHLADGSTWFYQGHHLWRWHDDDGLTQVAELAGSEPSLHQLTDCKFALHLVQSRRHWVVCEAG